VTLSIPSRYHSGDLAAKVLILGSTGFFGRAVAHAILDAGYQVRALVRDVGRAGALRVRGAELVVGDATHAPSLHAAAAGVDAIVDLVAVRRNRPQTFLAVNMESPRLVGEAAQANNVKKVVFVSAIGARPDPKYEYLVSRWAGEEALKRTGAPYVILRFSFILGEDGGVVDDFERAVHLGPIIVIPGSGEQHLQPIIREDAARCVVEAIGRADLYGQTLELGGPEILTYSQLFGFFCQARGIKKPRIPLPAALLMPGAAILEIFMNNPVATPTELKAIVEDNVAPSLDTVLVNFNFRAHSPSQWATTHWRDRTVK